MNNARLRKDHWVSRGYQKNFSLPPEHRVAVIDAQTGEIVDPSKPIKSNFQESGFTTFMDDDEVQTGLEDGFASVERTVLNQIREVSRDRRGATERAAVANLFAIHLVRSPSFKSFHAEVAESSRTKLIGRVTTDERTVAKHTELEGPPEPGALEQKAHQAYDQLINDPWTLADSTALNHDQIAAFLNNLHMQIIEIPPHLPGLVLADTPVTHADRRTKRYGFRDRLAIGDANLIVGPLTRRTAAAFTTKRSTSVAMKTRKDVDTLNAIFIRTADSKIVCHPGDAKQSRQAVWRRHDLPPERL